MRLKHIASIITIFQARRDKAAIQTYSKHYLDEVYAVTVGSETLYRGNFTAGQLLEKLNDMRSVVSDGVNIRTADSWNKYAESTADGLIKGRLDILLVNAFGFWQAHDFDNAKHAYFDMMQAYTHTQNVAGSTTSIEL